MEYDCLGCAEDTPAEYVWHDGLWTSYICATHARKQLPKRGLDSNRETIISNRGRDGIVSGYATPLGGSQKLVWKDEVDAPSSRVVTDGGTEQFSTGNNTKQPPTEVGSSFTITDLGTDNGGVAISMIADAFEDSFGDLALVVENEHGYTQTYSFKERDPIFCSHFPDDTHEPEVHGAQTIGFRYSYQFMRDIESGNPINVVNFEDTHLTDVDEIIYP